MHAWEMTEARPSPVESHWNSSNQLLYSVLNCGNGSRALVMKSIAAAEATRLSSSWVGRGRNPPEASALTRRLHVRVPDNVPRELNIRVALQRVDMRALGRAALTDVYHTITRLARLGKTLLEMLLP